MNSGNSGGSAVLSGAGPDVFAMTDEQILGMEPDEAAAPSAEESANLGEQSTARTTTGTSSTTETRTPARASQSEPPRWLAERMRDPWVGEEARELWDAAQLSQRESAAYRESFATPEEARALKELYPGGASEAKAAAERARELAEIDAAFFGAPGKSAENLRAGRTQLVERLYAQDPAAFREMVEAGRQILERATTGQLPATNAVSPTPPPASPATPSIPSIPHELATRYREFERAANADLEKTVGATIGRAMESALPNLKWAERTGSGHDGQTPPLSERLAAAVREDVEAALKSDTALGEQLARVLSGRRFDDATRTQVVRLIDARAQQLVPGAVRRVVSSWTAATLGGKKSELPTEERKTIAATRSANDPPRDQRSDHTTPRENSARPARGRVDYRKWSDEQILGM